MEPTSTQSYTCLVRWQDKDAYLLWVNREEPGRESLWADAQNRVPLFDSISHLAGFVENMGIKLEREVPIMINLDALVEWTDKYPLTPPKNILGAWGLFDDLSTGTSQLFIGNQKTKPRDKIFDLLYLDSDLDLPWVQTGEITWRSDDLTLLRGIMLQGISIWQQSVYWAS